MIHQPKPEYYKDNDGGFHYIDKPSPASTEVKCCDKCWKAEGKYVPSVFCVNPNCPCHTPQPTPSPASTEKREKAIKELVGLIQQNAEIEKRINSEEWELECRSLAGDVNPDEYVVGINIVKMLLSSHDQQLRQRIVAGLEKMKDKVSSEGRGSGDNFTHGQNKTISEVIHFITNLK